MKLYLLCLFIFNIFIKFYYVRGIEQVEEKIPEECKIYNSLKNLPNDYNCCNEECISNITVCNEQKEYVQCVNLSNMGLEIVPDSLKIFVKLKQLYLNNNSFNNLPEFFSNYNNLEILDISNNVFNDLPTSIINLPSIKKLNLSNNSIVNLSSSIGNLKTLTNLKISSNGMITIPKQIVNLYKLSLLDVSNNKIINLPDEIGYLFVLEDLNISNNPIRFLPKRIFKLAILKNLNIDDCPNLNVNFIYFDSPLEQCSFKNTNILCYFPGSCKALRNNIYNNYIEESKIILVNKCRDGDIKSAKEEMEKLDFIPSTGKDTDSNSNYNIFSFKNIIIGISILFIYGLICIKIGEKIKIKNSKDFVIYERHKVVTPRTEVFHREDPDITIDNTVATPNRTAVSDSITTSNSVEISNDVATSQVVIYGTKTSNNKDESIINATPVNTCDNDDKFLLLSYNEGNNVETSHIEEPNITESKNIAMSNSVLIHNNKNESIFNATPVNIYDNDDIFLPPYNE